MVTDTPIPSCARLPAHLHDPLVERGFVRDGRVYRLDELTFAEDGPWLVFKAPAHDPGGWSLASGMGQPGLWKWAPTGAPPQSVFEVPAWVVNESPEEDRFGDAGAVPFAEVLAWAMETRFPRVRPGWRPPAPDLVESWTPRGALTVQAKGCVRQGELILGTDRWALRIPILPRLPEDLPGSRRRALRKLVIDAQRRRAMVRIGVPLEVSPAALVAEVDLTGAPHSELLFSAGLDVLRHVVAWLAETAEVLADPSIEIKSLAPDADNPTDSTERKTP